MECAVNYFDREASLMRSGCSTWGCHDFGGGEMLLIISMPFISMENPAVTADISTR